MERVGEQANTKKKAKRYSLKFKYSNSNSKSSSNMCYDFKVKSGVLLEVNFRHILF